MTVDLCDETDVAHVLGGITPSGARSASLIANASQRVTDYLGHDPNERAAEVATLSARTRSRLIWVPEKHVTAVASVVEDGTTLTEGNDADFVWYENGRLQRLSGYWYATKPLAIVVTYDAGWTAIPPPIVQAAAQIVARQWAAGVAYAAIDAVGAVGFESEAMPDGYRYKVPAGATLNTMLATAGRLDESDKELLNVYRRVW